MGVTRSVKTHYHPCSRFRKLVHPPIANSQLRTTSAYPLIFQRGLPLAQRRRAHGEGSRDCEPVCPRCLCGAPASPSLVVVLDTVIDLLLSRTQPPARPSV